MRTLEEIIAREQTKVKGYKQNLEMLKNCGAPQKALTNCVNLAEEHEMLSMLLEELQVLIAGQSMFLCNVGDTVYFPDKEINFVFPVKISQIVISDLGDGKQSVQYNGCFFNCDGDPSMEFEFDNEDFCKIVFFSKEEAVQQLMCQSSAGVGPTGEQNSVPVLTQDLEVLGCTQAEFEIVLSNILNKNDEELMTLARTVKSRGDMMPLTKRALERVLTMQEAERKDVFDFYYDED